MDAEHGPARSSHAAAGAAACGSSHTETVFARSLAWELSLAGSCAICGHDAERPRRVMCSMPDHT
jgi:hypothetical protein